MLASCHQQLSSSCVDPETCQYSTKFKPAFGTYNTLTVFDDNNNEIGELFFTGCALVDQEQNFKPDEDFEHESYFDDYPERRFTIPVAKVKEMMSRLESGICIVVDPEQDLDINFRPVDVKHKLSVSVVSRGDRCYAVKNLRVGGYSSIVSLPDAYSLIDIKAGDHTFAIIQLPLDRIDPDTEPINEFTITKCVKLDFADPLWISFASIDYPLKWCDNLILPPNFCVRTRTKEEMKNQWSLYIDGKKQNHFKNLREKNTSYNRSIRVFDCFIGFEKGQTEKNISLTIKYRSNTATFHMRARNLSEESDQSNQKKRTLVDGENEDEPIRKKIFYEESDLISIDSEEEQLSPISTPGFGNETSNQHIPEFSQEGEQISSIETNPKPRILFTSNDVNFLEILVERLFGINYSTNKWVCITIYLAFSLLNANYSPSTNSMLPICERVKNLISELDQIPAADSFHCTQSFLYWLGSSEYNILVHIGSVLKDLLVSQTNQGKMFYLNKMIEIISPMGIERIKRILNSLIISDTLPSESKVLTKLVYENIKSEMRQLFETQNWVLIDELKLPSILTELQKLLDI